MIHVHHIIAHLQLVDFLEGDDGFATTRILRTECHAVVALEYLVISIAADLRPMVDESLV